MSKRLVLVTIDGWGRAAFGIGKKGVTDDAPLKFWRESVKKHSTFYLESTGESINYDFLRISDPQFGMQTMGTCSPMPIDEDIIQQAFLQDNFAERAKQIPGVSKTRVHVFCTLSDDQKYLVDELVRFVPFLDHEYVFMHFFLDKINSGENLFRVQKSVQDKLNVVFASVSGINWVNGEHSNKHQEVLETICKGFKKTEKDYNEIYGGKNTVYKKFRNEKKTPESEVNNMNNENISHRYNKKGVYIKKDSGMGVYSKRVYEREGSEKLYNSKNRREGSDNLFNSKNIREDSDNFYNCKDKREDSDNIYNCKDKREGSEKLYNSKNRRVGSDKLYNSKNIREDSDELYNSKNRREDSDNIYSFKDKREDSDNFYNCKDKREDSVNIYNINSPINGYERDLSTAALIPISVDNLYLYISQNTAVNVSDRDIAPFLFDQRARIFPLDSIIFLDHNIIDYLIFARKLQSINPCFTLHPFNTLHGIETAAYYPYPQSNIFDHFHKKGIRSLGIAEQNYVFDMKRFITGNNKPVDVTTAFLSYEDFFTRHRLNPEDLDDWKLCLKHIFKTQHDFYLLNFHFLMKEMETRPYTKSYEYVVWIDAIITIIEELCNDLEISLMVCGTSAAVEKCVYSVTEGGDFRGEMNGDQLPFVIYDGKNEHPDIALDKGFTLLDVAPTLLHFFEIDIPDYYKGRSLLTPESRSIDQYLEFLISDSQIKD